MPDAILIALHEFSWTPWLRRRRAVFDVQRRAVVHTASCFLPRVRCRLWAARRGYQLGGAASPIGSVLV